MLVIGAGGFVGSHLREQPPRLVCGWSPLPGGRARRFSPATCSTPPRSRPASRRRGRTSSSTPPERPRSDAAGSGRARPSRSTRTASSTCSRPWPRRHRQPMSSASPRPMSTGRGEEELPLGEELEPRPVTPYGASKAAMEVLCGQYARSWPSDRGRPRLQPDRPRPVAAVRGSRLRPPHRRGRAGGAGGGRAGPGQRRRRPRLHRRPRRRPGTAGALAAGMGGTYNLCSGRGTTIAELAEELTTAAWVAVTFRHDPALERPADPPALVGDPRRLREATGFEPAIPLEREPRRPARVLAHAPRQRLGPAPLNILRRWQAPETAAEEAHRTIAPLVGPDDERIFTDSGIEIEPLYAESDVAPGLRSVSASRVRRPSPAASTSGCTATGSGRCASTPASPRRRTPTSATAT